jgi:hypothetical protein
LRRERELRADSRFFTSLYAEAYECPLPLRPAPT